MATPDSYESRYMDAGGAVFRSRKAMPWWFFALVGVGVLAGLASAVGSGNPVALLTLPLLVAAMLALAMVRVVVTREHLHVQLGLWGPKIALASITKIEAMDYPFLRYGGWGIRRGIDGSWAYSTPGGNGRGVRIEWRDGDKQKVTFVSSNEADELARTVLELQGHNVTSGVRVDATEAQLPRETADAPAERAGAAKGERGVS